MVYTLITLYPSSETEFKTNGLGSLGEAAECIVTEEANGSFELELVYPITGRRYKDLTNRSIIFAKPNPVDSPQPFRIYEISRPMNGLVTFYAAHISYDLSGYPIKPFKAGSAVGAMSGLKTNSVSKHPFTFWTDKNVTSDFLAVTPMPTRSALGGVRGSILDTYGGEYKFDRFDVKLYTHRGANRGVTIRYGKNLTDLNQEENCSKVYTGVLPYWRDEQEDILVQLPETIVPTEGTYDFINIYTLDLTSEFQEQPTVEALRSRTQKYIKDNKLGVPKVSLTVSFIQLEQTEEYKDLQFLERVELFDTITVEFPEMEVSSTAKVCKTVYNVLAGRYDSVTIGEVRASISDTIVSQDDEMDEIANETKSQLRREVDKATEWIVNGRGYMVAVKDETGNWMEICSLDTPNIDTAVNVWRWNNGGFGHSSHGYGGPYDVAITQDGHIVADFITTGTLTASLIKAGVLKSNDGETFFLDLEAGILKMKATEFSIGGKTVEEISKNEAEAAVDAQTQESIFNKLTNNGKTQGIYMSNGLVYINASYIKAGILTDGKGNNTWDLVNGTLIAKNITAYGSFRCGSPTATSYMILDANNQLRGYRDSVQVGYIDYTAAVRDVGTGVIAYGLQLQANGVVRISSPRLSVINSSDTSVTSWAGQTVEFTQYLVTKIENIGDGRIRWYNGYLYLRFINGILIASTYTTT